MKERIRVAGIIKMNGGYALMHRKNDIKKKDFQDYYAFPGGGLEEGETLEEGVIREIKEEFGINVEVIKKLYEMESNKLNQKEYFFLCEYIDGEFGTGDGPEFNNDPKYIECGEFLPEIIKEEEIKNLLLLPPEIKEKFVEDIKNNKIM